MSAGPHAGCRFKRRDRERPTTTGRDGARALHAVGNPTIEFGLRAKDALAKPLRALHLDEPRHGDADGQLVGDGNGYVGNPDLKPETARTASVSVDWHMPATGSGRSRLTPYLHRCRRLRRRAALLPAMRSEWPCTADNLSRDGGLRLPAIRQPVRAALRHRLSGQSPARRSTATGRVRGRSAARLHERQRTATTGDKLYNIMPLNAKLALTHKHGGWDNRLEVEWSAAKDEVSAVRNEVETAGLRLASPARELRWNGPRWISASRTCSTVLLPAARRRLPRPGHDDVGNRRAVGYHGSGHGSFDLRRGEADVLSLLDVTAAAATTTHPGCRGRHASRRRPATA